jgi:hypothetical protein
LDEKQHRLLAHRPGQYPFSCGVCRRQQEEEVERRKGAAFHNLHGVGEFFLTCEICRIESVREAESGRPARSRVKPPGRRHGEPRLRDEN